jgi:hypothetical protein
MIAGFVTVRNGIDNGYPFVEAIRSALPLCEEVHVSDGYSTDGSYEVLKRLAEREPKLRLRRDHWDTGGPAGNPYRNILNAVRRDLTEPVLFQFDANEIVPPEAVPLLRELPGLYPRRDLFALPYHQFVGRYWFNEEFRFRFFRNLPTVWALWDGWTFGYHLQPHDLLRPREFRRALARTALAVVQDRVRIDLPEQWIHLPRPIFHYYGLFPEAFFGKMLAKVWLQANPGYRDLTPENPRVQQLLEAFRQTGDYDGFWRAVWDQQRAVRQRGLPLNKEFLYLRAVPDAEHPESVRKHLGAARYVPPD